MQVFDLLTRLRKVSPAAARVLLTRLVPRIIPLSGGMGVRVEEWSAARCVLVLPFKRRNRNHIGSMYFGAQMTLADLAVGLLLFQHFPMDSYGGVIKRVEADFRAKGKGELRCVAELPTDCAEALDGARWNESGKAEAWIPMQLIDPSGKTVTEVRTLVAIKRFGPAEPRS
jgi:acyl-coenzyme A thioesterase PaaI-like protein